MDSMEIHGTRMEVNVHRIEFNRILLKLHGLPLNSFEIRWNSKHSMRMECNGNRIEFHGIQWTSYEIP